MRFLPIGLLSFLSIGTPLDALAIKPLWTSHSVSHLHGNDYIFGSKERDTVTLEHASGWEFGDLFAFVDIVKPRRGEAEAYGEIHPRLSLSYLSGKRLSYGVVKDVFLAAELEKGHGGHQAWLYGLGTSLALPGFSFFWLNAYVRDERGLEGVAYQISPAWSVELPFSPLRLSLEGFADLDGGQGSRRSSLLFVPQAMIDVGEAAFGKRDVLKIGTEWQYWRRKFGVDGADESVFQTLVKIRF
jgi:nucleoside-specific outer membrane channel protein Tsx